MNRQFFILVTAMIASFGVDRFSKFLILSFLDGQRVFFWGKTFFFGYIPTEIHTGLSELPLYIVVSIFIFIIIGLWVVGVRKLQPTRAVGFGLILGGGAGNIFDRISVDHVIDWIGVAHVFVCNLADVMIVGGIIICLYTFYDRTSTFRGIDRT
ncbi:MAG: signal peptidase II [bacterium]|nr:signal peptidase II [bacterium]